MGQAKVQIKRQILNNLERLRLLRLQRAGVLGNRDGVSIDAASSIDPSARVAHHASLRASHLGRHTSIGRFSKLAHADLGPFCSISWDVTIGAIGHPHDHPSTHAFAYVPEVGGYVTERHQQIETTNLGADVWVGANAVIMPGVTIGPGAIVGASAVITHDVAPYAIVDGVPGRPRGTRFPVEMVDRLLTVAWWEWPTNVLREHIQLFQEPLSERTLAELEAVRPS